MEQLNNVPPALQEEIKPAAETAFEKKVESPLLSKMREKFGFFGGVSLIFGGFFAFSFYKTGMGINALFFTIVMIAILCLVMNKLSVPIKRGTIAYYTGAILFGVSTALTSSDTLQFFNVIGIVCILNLSLLHQFQEDLPWDFTKYIGKMLSLILFSITAIGMPFLDAIRLLKHTKLFKNDKVMNVFLGVIISIPILWIVIALLSGADLLFGNMTKEIYEFLFSPDIIAVFFMILIGFMACYCIICSALVEAGKEVVRVRRKAASSIAVTAMFLICLVYALFCGIQVIYLFTNGLFILPEGYTFAEYARRGFFELLAVTILNIILMLLCSALFEGSKLLRLLLTFMTVCTYIMIISATYRMLLYIGAYHLTFLRLFVLLSLLIDAFILAGVIASEYRKEFPLFRYSVAVITVGYLVFSFAKPDYFIASYLNNQSSLLTLEDAAFLTQELSLDAAPIVLPLLKDPSRWTEEKTVKREYRDSENNEYYEYYDEWISLSFYSQEYYNRISLWKNNMGIRDFNYSNYLAVNAVEDYPRN